jgi:ribosome biogenesis GTPase A
VETLDIIGKKRGCLERGGLVDYDKVYTIIMNDIKMGIVKGITFDRVDNYGL